ncbi:HlyD family type I secretion periplasmic adaptor subunit [Atlantibacter hermannii]|uniref:Membrane fusion protein (MFP) family protein n=4 Tax=Atlantibacter hermannii TaxID=565 RepID=H5V7H7_ATLHE|nr:HlyD family type I secretion periplasmic adaptor subunit [Atlantibacter hermannii]MCQ4968115.1 HlyD family type I secretion periplasmic adaptor subunit [Enterobacteriaceae bacterium DFI.7.85]KIU33746.1 secretion protein HlyD [Atlantibacter hermannii]MDQ7881236.1 HlyD family type I secretion periplasmic adaptor subunit [Atlantibacter hermannii]MDU1950651.1 HlyD family type I secretion periplasmic adaptor subunit [Atlantibacter hermannii]MDU7812164.1 HlyD family type I secretion periplasmic a
MAAPSLVTQDLMSQPKLGRSSLLVWMIFLLLAGFLVWAKYFSLDEVSTGGGKVIPSSREQVVQSLEGGIIYDLRVREGDIVERGQLLAELDRTKTQSSVQESASRLRAALARAARLEAEVNDRTIKFPGEVINEKELVKTETELYISRKTSLDQGLIGLQQGISLVRQQLNMTEPLVKQGAASGVEVLRLKTQLNDLNNKITDLKSQYYVRAREELNRTNEEVEALRSVMRGREDSLTRLKMYSPVRGIVKNIEVTTVGGVIPPNGKLLTLVPMNDDMLIEARISPRDVAFIHPGQPALVKITAYDYAIYGGLPGEVTMISPDSIQDDVKRDIYYYRVYIRTKTNYLENKQKQRFPIFPGMVATVDIKTGSRTVLDYLIKPLNKVNEALRER